MADNVGYTPGTGATVSADEVTYSSDTSLVQLVRPVLVTGAEGSKTVVDLPGDNTNGLDVDVTRVSGNVTVVQGTSSNLKADANITNASLAVTQATAANLNATVVGSGNFTVVQPTAANLNATVSGTVTADAGTGNFTVVQGTASNLKTDANITNASVTVAQATAANLNATVTGTVTANAGTGSFTVAQATAANLNATVAQATASSLNATVVGPAAEGASQAGNPLLIAGADTSNLVRVLTCAADGNLFADVMGTAAHDAVDIENPVKIGMRARSAVITSVASDDRTDAIGTLQGYLITYPYALPQSALTGTASSTGTGDTAVIAAQGAGITINVTTITVYNDSTTNTFVNIKDGATTRLVVPAPAKGGAMITLPSPLRITANTAFNFASASGVTTMYVSAVGFAGI